MSLLSAVLQEEYKIQTNGNCKTEEVVEKAKPGKLDHRKVEEWRNSCSSLSHEISAALHQGYVTAGAQNTLVADTWLHRTAALRDTGARLLGEHHKHQQVFNTIDTCIRRAKLAKGGQDSKGITSKRQRHWTELTELVIQDSQEGDDHYETENAVKKVISSRLNRCLHSVCTDFRNILSYSATPHSLKVEIDVSDPERLQEVMNTLAYSKRITIELADFASFLIKHAFPKLTLEKCEIDVKRDPRKVSIVVYFGDSSARASVTKMVDNLMTFFDLIQSTIDCRWDDDRTLFSILGQLARKDFYNIVKKEIVQIISRDESVVSEISRLENYLYEISFIEEKQSPLSVFAEEASQNVYKYELQNWLSEIRKLIEHDLRDNVLRVEKKDQDAKCFEQTKIISRDDYGQRNIVESPHLFPECSISGNVKLILINIIQALNTGYKSSIAQANETVINVRRAVEMYFMLTPKFHEEVLNSSPVDLALFYNNSFYLAHALLGHPWKNIFDKQFANNINSVLGDLIQNLRLGAVSKFSAFIKSQRQFIKDTLTKSELNNINTIQRITNNSEQAVQVCIERLKYLHKVWQPILPIDMLKRTMSNLCAVVANNLIEILMNVKDRTFGECLTRELHQLFTVVLEKLSEYFSENVEEHLQNRDWQRFTELTSVLNCPMFAIATRWNKEKGQLSKLFSQEEIRHFIRIIFLPGKQKSTVLNMIQ